MYPQQELRNLAELKTSLRHRITRRRAAMRTEGERVLQPLRWVDRAYATWQRIGPIARLAAGPVGVWLLRRFTGRRKTAGRLLRWGPILWNFARGFLKGRAEQSAA